MTDAAVPDMADGPVADSDDSLIALTAAYLPPRLRWGEVVANLLAGCFASVATLGEDKLENS